MHTIRSGAQVPHAPWPGSVRFTGAKADIMRQYDRAGPVTHLAPALPRITGHASWWAPAPVRRLGARFGLSEQGTPPVHDARPQAPVAAATVATQPPAVHPQRSAGSR